MFLIGDLSIPNFFIALQPDILGYGCSVTGNCPDVSAAPSSFSNAITEILDFFLNETGKTDPKNDIYPYIFNFCKVIAGIGALWFITPVMIDYSQQGYVANLKKVSLLFLLMLMFAGQGNLGKSIAYGNYAVIQGIHKGIQETFNKNTDLRDKRKILIEDRNKASELELELSNCSKLPATKGASADPNIQVANPAFTSCINAIQESIKQNKYKFSNPSINAALEEAAAQTSFTDMASIIKSKLSGISMVNPNQNSQEGNTTNNNNTEIKNLLIGWRAAIAIVPDIALVGAVLVFPFPLALSFINISYLQSWFAGMWSVGLFKFIMTIFSRTFIFIQVALTGEMPQNTQDLILGILLPTIAISIATNSGLGLSSLVSQGVSSLSSKLTGTSSYTGDANRNATAPTNR